MTGADSNVLLRYLVSDDIQQQKTVERFLASTRVAGEIVYVSCIVVCEMVWVLRRLYALSVPDVLDKIERLLNADVFRVEDEDIVRRAVESSRHGKGDFAGYLIGHLNLARGCRHTVTFDRDLRTDSAFSVL